VGAAAGAMEVVRAGDAVADLLRTDFSGQVSKLFWRREALPVYEAGIRLSHAAGDAEDAFYFLEKSRAILLLESLLETAARAEIDPILASELSRVEEELLTTRRNLLIEAGSANDRQRLLGLSDTLSNLQEELAVRYPRGTGRFITSWVKTVPMPLSSPPKPPEPSTWEQRIASKPPSANCWPTSPAQRLPTTTPPVSFRSATKST